MEIYRTGRMRRGYVDTRMAWLAVLLLVPSLLHAQAAADSVGEAVGGMNRAAGASLEVTRSRLNGLATFVRAESARPIPAGAASATPEEHALAFLTTHGQAFAVADVSQVEVTRVQKGDAVGMDHVRLRQLYRGVPVTGGELSVHLRGGGVVAVAAKTLAALDTVDTVPTISPEQALSSARALLAKHLAVTDAVLSTPRLELFNRGLLDGARAPTRLAWFIEATRVGLREFLWVDAQRGAVLLHFNQLPQALSRSIYDAMNAAVLPGTLVRSEGGPLTGDTDADAAYLYFGDTYNYYFTQHGRDSYDDAGASLIGTVHFCPSADACPFANAAWTGSQMIFGDGFAAADDVIAHELTHAVTDSTANLFYYMQSGALNESLSDIFGETVDLTNHHGNDAAAVRWLMGEDLPIGSIRSMSDPTLFGDPGKLSDPQFRCVTDTGISPPPPRGDGGGVHHNSGVPNHAYALMTDGGTYNGVTVSGIGLTKAGQLTYRALSHYLLSASDFLDYDNAIRQSCTDLVGTAGITTSDCTEATKALQAVEMANVWPCAPAQAPVPDACPAGQSPVNLFADDLENTTSGNWTTNVLSGGVNHWGDGVGDEGLYFSGFATSGTYHFWGYDLPALGSSAVEMKRDVVLPAGGARMQFNHSYGFEQSASGYWDGAVVEYSTNGGTSWADAGSLITAGAAYGGAISSQYGNPLGGRQAFVADSFGYTATQLNLSSLAGNNVRFRFLIGTDSSVDDYGWYLDDIRIYRCVTGPGPTATPTITPTPGGCVGDCSGDNKVTVDELVKGVNIALGILAFGECPQFDYNGDHKVTVDELVTAVNSALNGCAAPPPPGTPTTPTPSATRTAATPTRTATRTQTPTATRTGGANSGLFTGVTSQATGCSIPSGIHPSNACETRFYIAPSLTQLSPSPLVQEGLDPAVTGCPSGPSFVFFARCGNFVIVDSSCGTIPISNGHWSVHQTFPTNPPLFTNIDATCTGGTCQGTYSSSAGEGAEYCETSNLTWTATATGRTSAAAAPAGGAVRLDKSAVAAAQIGPHGKRTFLVAPHQSD